jgi:ribosomal protein S18 acetylase RimI-like enzyme
MGIAQRLFKYATDWSRGRKRESMWLGVWEQNPRGQAFYRKMGFEVVGEHSFVVGASVRRDWVMEVRI